MFIFYEPETGNITFTVFSAELPAVLSGPWICHEGDPGDLTRLCVQDGKLVLHPEAAAIDREAQQTARRRAFAAETDPMIGQVLRKEIALSVYERAVAEIRHRYPYPEDQN